MGHGTGGGGVLRARAKSVIESRDRGSQPQPHCMRNEIHRRRGRPAKHELTKKAGTCINIISEANKSKSAS